jgi:hypothetical protein
MLFHFVITVYSTTLSLRSLNSLHLLLLRLSIPRIPVIDFELHGAVVVHRVGRLDVGLQVQFQIVQRRERKFGNDVVEQLIDHALHNRFIYTIEGSFDFFFGLGAVM